ncbi:MAG: DUF4880 domain-containing protein [Gammaproteobacteria bacterium]|nr:DUF4880 domain-containing protein [Gammaproteobacteria bacterium]
MNEIAAQWIIREGAGNLSAAERKALSQWLAASPENEASYRDARRVWELSGELAQIPEIQAELSALRQQRESRLARGTLWRRTLVAAAAACVVLAAIIIWELRPDTQWYETSLGQHEEITLKDGSTLALGSNTRAGVRFSRGLRRLILERGEVLAEVAHDPRRQFIAEAGPGSVLAVGTRLQQPTGWGIDEALKLIRIEIDPEEISRAAKAALNLMPMLGWRCVLSTRRWRTRRSAHRVSNNWARSKKTWMKHLVGYNRNMTSTAPFAARCRTMASLSRT